MSGFIGSTLLCDPRELDGIDPAKTVHMCIDVQKFYFEPESFRKIWGNLGDEDLVNAGPVVAERIASLAPLFNRAGLAKTIWVHHLSDFPGEEWHLVEPGEGDDILGKKFESAFNQTSLDDRLKKLGAETLVLTGGFASICVSYTAMDALKKGYNVIVLLDGIHHFEKPHDKEALKNQFAAYSFADETCRYAIFTTSEVLLQRLQEYPRASCPVPPACIAG